MVKNYLKCFKLPHDWKVANIYPIFKKGHNKKLRTIVKSHVVYLL